MDFGVQVNVYRVTWPDIVASVQAMEAGDWDSVWFADHHIPPGGGGNDEQEAMTAFEGLAAIATVAGMTKKLRLGNLVLGNPYRNPAHAALIAGTIDTMSEGRFTLGIGAGWYQREHEAYGWKFPSMKERQDRFEEACELIRLLFRSDEPVDFNGKYYQLDHAQLSPGNYDNSKPIPIMVGGTGPKRTLRTLARYGDVMNLDGWAGGGLSLDYYKYKAGILEQHCEDCGRDPAEIRRTLTMPCMLTDDKTRAETMISSYGEGTVAGSKQYVIDRIGEFQDAGIHEIIFGALPSGNVELLKQFEEEILSAFR
jgi:alkanesulfonate monooxygenase SsuD/methylene tetrahydromethanopterin reductase-like flavin-dependent oxidoreductase (luciferase family)